MANDVEHLGIELFVLLFLSSKGLLYIQGPSPFSNTGLQTFFISVLWFAFHFNLSFQIWNNVCLIEIAQ